MVRIEGQEFTGLWDVAHIVWYTRVNVTMENLQQMNGQEGYLKYYRDSKYFYNFIVHKF